MKLKLVSDWLGRKMHVTYMENENIFELNRFWILDLGHPMSGYIQQPYASSITEVQ